MSPMKQNEFYCVAIRQRVTKQDKDICVVMMKNKKVAGGVPALFSVHRYDGKESKMYKFIARESYDRMVSKYGKC
jgi:hypothetical protein